jgi:hypothetical protein
MALALPALGLMTAKTAIDLGFHLWTIRLYRDWTGDRTSPKITHAFFAAVIEPYSFQLLRHTGAAWGWISLLTDRHSWGVQSRSGLLSSEREPKVDRKLLPLKWSACSTGNAVDLSCRMGGDREDLRP